LSINRLALAFIKAMRCRQRKACSMH